MKLLRLKFKNLFSLGAGEIELQARGLTLVTGFSQDEGSSNGAGKSSLTNKAILWTLFGETAGGLKADAVLNRHGKRKCFGEIHFEGTDGATYRLKRERPAKLSLFKGDVDISAHTAKETQAIVTPLLGCDFKTFVQTSFFGQGRMIHYPSLPPKEQKAVLEQILPMEAADRWAEEADKQVKATVPKVKEAELKVFGASGRADTLRGQLERCRADGTRFEQGRRVQIEHATETLEQIKDRFKPDWERLETTKVLIDGSDDAEFEKAITEEVASQVPFMHELEAARETLAEINHSASQWRTRRSFLRTQFDEISQDIKCPVCLRDYDETTVEAVKQRAELQNQLIEEADLNVTRCVEADDYYSAEDVRLRAAINNSVSRIDNLKTMLNRKAEYDRDKEVLEARISAAEAGAHAAMAAAKGAENPHAATYSRLEKDIDEAEAYAHKLDSHHATLSEELEHLTYWRDVYGKELKLKLFEDACPFLDARTEYHLNRLRNAQIHCDFSTVKRLSNGEAKEEFNVNVWSETGGKGFESLSGGEQQMVSFAVGLSLADLAGRVAGSTSGFLILDEPFTELDERNGEAVVEYLTTEVENGRDTVFLISNEKSLKGLVPNRIHVIKSAGVSNVSTQ